MKAKLIVAVAFLVLFTSCASFTESPDTTVQGQSLPRDRATSNLKMFTDINGAYTMAAGQYGFYEIDSSAGHGNILYTDFETRTRVYLCNRPDCAHNADGCTSYLGDDVFSGRLFLNPSNTSLFMIGNYNLDLGIPERLWQMKPNGDDRKLVYSFATNETMLDAVVGNDEYLYITVDVTYAETQTVGKELRRIEIRTGTVLTLLNYQQTGWVSGVADDKIIMSYAKYDETGTYSERPFTLYSPDTGEETEIFNMVRKDGYSGPQDIAFMMFGPSTLITLANDGGTVSQLYKTNLLTMQRTLICEKIPTPDLTRVVLYPPIDEAIEIDSIAIVDGEAVRERYIVDLNTGKLQQISIQYNEWEYVKIQASYKDYYYVSYDEELRKITLIGNEGVPYTEELGFKVYGMILKSDFWSNETNYIPITDTVTS